MGTYGVIDFDEDEIEAAGHWYGGQGSMLYAITSTGALSRGTIRPRHPEGGLMTDEEWIVDLAERLEGEAEEAARDAAKQAKKAKGAERKELLADREGLRSIALKAGQFVRDAARAQKSSHATRKYGKKASEKVERTLHEFKRGKLKSGSGAAVTSRKQAIAIGLSQARARGYKVPSVPAHAVKKTSAQLNREIAGVLSGNRSAGVKTPLR
jgi:Family of unknown function (DUF6496)